MRRLFRNYWKSVREEWKKTYLHLIIKKLSTRIKLWLVRWWVDLMELVAGVRRRVAQYKAEEYHARTGKKVNVIDGRFNTAIVTRESRKTLKKTGLMKKSSTAVDVDKVSHQIIQQGSKSTNKKNQVQKRRRK